MEQQFFTIQIERRETRMERRERRKRELRRNFFAAVLAILAAALFAALAVTEPVIVVTKEPDQNLQPVVLIVPEAGEV